MAMTADPDASTIDRVVAHAVAELHDRPELELNLRRYFAHVDDADLASRRVEDLFGLAIDHLELAAAWTPDSVAVNLANPRVELDGWRSDHTVLQVVAEDIPFLVNSVTMELSRLGIGIHLVLHPIIELPVDGADPIDRRSLSLICMEIDRQAQDEDRARIAEDLRRVIDDVRAAVRDWQPMRERMCEIASSLDPSAIPVDDDEIAESRELLEWLATDHFTFIGARDYELTTVDGHEVLRIVPGSGLGILDGEEHLGRPRRTDDLPPDARSRVHEVRLLNLTKASSRSTVHRGSYLDYVGIKTFDESGRVSGERRFLGLFTAELYTRSVTEIPKVRRTTAKVIEAVDYPSGGHDETKLLAILEQYPRDDLLQMEPDELQEIAVAIAGLQERRRVRVFPRRELFGRFLTILVYLPRDRYNTGTRSGIEELLVDTYGGSLAEWDAQMSESVLARLRFVLRLDGEPRGDTADVEERIEELIHVWDDDFADALNSRFGEDTALDLQRRFGEAFTVTYQNAFEPRVAAADVAHLAALDEPGALRLGAYRRPGYPPSAFNLKVYSCGERLSLTSIMPSLTNLGVTVVDESPYEVRPAGQEPVWIYDFALEYGALGTGGLERDFAAVSALVEEAFAAVWSGAVEDDGFNQLVLRAGLRPAEVAVIRAYARYLQQIRLPYNTTFVEQTLADHPHIVRLLFDLFAARFDPARLEAERADDVAAIETCIIEAIDDIESLDHDRVLRKFHNLIMATLRTTWAQRTVVTDGLADSAVYRGSAGGDSPHLGFKFDCSSIDELPAPRPAYEIFVYSPEFEGVHLRAGAVARGGLRWSDRSEDYRTEVLGLVKAQIVKNAVIVPVGAKGGFVLKRRSADPGELREQVAHCYRRFVAGLLDLTDNLVDGAVVPPDRTVRYDDDDPYLVVAADKGTATFSDLGNEIAIDRGFWLGDAFASGGSNGYDHKGMGITARGAWESVKRHFHELGIDVQSEPFTVVGVGDMSGDVFGNGMLRSPFIRLVAAFDHRHIFIDPDPDPATSYAERRRLFELPQSSWADYDPAVLSDGGGVYERAAKSIELTPQARKALGIDPEEPASMTPEALIGAVLRAPVDLLWNGGIGTYVKASAETDLEVGDKANDRIRIDASDLHCAVVGEGGNLGVTQRARVEFARQGGRIFTDAIDNVAGVDCSDHEVNIKILLDRVVADGDLTDKQRNELLQQMTDDVALLVLGNSFRQSLALSTARVHAASLVEVHARYLDDLEQQGQLDRALEAMPDGEEMAERRLANAGLTTPELAVLSAYTKNMLKEALLESAVPDDEAMTPLLTAYFPPVLVERFGERIRAHQLRREIIANELANLVVDRAGSTMAYRLAQETASPTAEVAAAHYAAWEIFDLDAIVIDTNALQATLAVDQHLAIHLACQQLAERAARLLLRNRPAPLDAAAAVDELAAAVQTTTAGLAEVLVGADRLAFEAQVNELVDAGAPLHLAERVAGLSSAVAALDIVAVSAESGEDLATVSAAHFAIADQLDLTWLRDRILALPRDTQWSTLARLTLRTDLYTDHRELTRLVLAGSEADIDAGERLDGWIYRNRSDVERYRQTMVAIRSTNADVTSLLVAAREVRNLINRIRPS